MARFRPRGRVGARRSTRRRLSPARRGAVVVAMVALVAVGAVLAARAYRARPPGPITGRAGSTLVRGAPDVAIAGPAQAYEITYRVETTAGGSTTVSTEKLSVKRPFDARVEVREGAPPGDALLSVQLSAFGAVERPAVGASGRFATQVPPDLAVSDLRPDAHLPALVARGIAQRREVREVAGRRCQVFRFGDSILSGRVVAHDTGRPTFADECIDAAGLLLEDVWVSEGARLRRKYAVQVRDAGALSDGVKIGPPFIEVKDGGGAIRPVDPASHAIGDSYELSHPEGYEYRGRWAVVPPQPSAAGDPGARSRLVAGTSDVWVRGIDVVILEQGGTLGGVEPFTEDVSLPAVAAGQAGTGRLALDLRMNEVRVLVGGGHYVRLLATRSPEELTAMAATLRKITGGTGLRYL